MVLTYLCPVTDMPKPMTYFRLAAYPVYFRPRQPAEKTDII